MCHLNRLKEMLKCLLNRERLPSQDLKREVLEYSNQRYRYQKSVQLCLHCEDLRVQLITQQCEWLPPCLPLGRFCIQSSAGFAQGLIFVCAYV